MSSMASTGNNLTSSYICRATERTFSMHRHTINHVTRGQYQIFPHIVVVVVVVDGGGGGGGNDVIIKFVVNAFYIIRTLLCLHFLTFSLSFLRI